MLPRELPISDEVVQAVTDALWEPDETSGEIRHEKWQIDGARDAIIAFLQAEGFELESMAADSRSATQFAPQSRLVSPWKPAPSSTEGGEG